MKKQAARLANVQVVASGVIKATYTDGRMVSVDMNGIISGYAAFAPLSERTEFETVAVADWGWSLEWSCSATLDADRLFELSLEHAMLLPFRVRPLMKSSRLSGNPWTIISISAPRSRQEKCTNAIQL